jgi:hypothetical protein
MVRAITALALGDAPAAAALAAVPSDPSRPSLLRPRVLNNLALQPGLGAIA